MAIDYKREADHYQHLLLGAEREVRAGNERMRPMMEAYANQRDTYNILAAQELLDNKNLPHVAGGTL